MCLTDSDSLALISPLSTETVKNDNEDDGDGCPGNHDDDDVMHNSDIHSEAPIFNGVQRRSVRIEAIVSNVSTISQPSTQTSMTPLSSTPSRKRPSVCKEQFRKRNINNKQLNNEVSFDQSEHTSAAKRNSYQSTDYSKVCYTPGDSNPNAVKFSNVPYFANYPYDSSFSSCSTLSPSLKSDLSMCMNKNGSTNANDDNSKYNNNNNIMSNSNSQWQYTDTRKNTNQYTSPVQISCRANIMKKKTERQHRNKQSNVSPMLPSLSTTPFSSQIKSMGDELSERRANQRKERSRLAAQIRRNREGQSLMLIQNALPISSYVLGLSLVHLNSNSSNSASGTTQPSSKNNELGTGKSNNSTGTTLNTTEAASTSLVTPPTTISSTPSAINLEKTGVLRIAGHTLFLLNKLSSYLGLHTKLSVALNSRSVYGMLIDSKELRIAYATPALADAVGWPWIKLLGAPLHKLVKFTESSPNSKEITKKLLSKSHWSSLTTQSSFNSTKNASISNSSPNTSNNNNNNNHNSPVNIESDNEFSLPEFITLSKLIPYKQQTLSTTKINKPDDTNSKSSPTIPVNTKDLIPVSL
ncbi:unnamed protein product [Trichobilharzia szidati]|nr:unnamed protein product [Trichobilharzia szidati]